MESDSSVEVNFDLERREGIYEPLAEIFTEMTWNTRQTADEMTTVKCFKKIMYQSNEKRATE